MKAQEIEHILFNAIHAHPTLDKETASSGTSKAHLLRAVFIAVDLTSSMADKDFKPTRISISLKMIKKLLQDLRDTTPLCKFLVAIVENELCKPLQDFSYDEREMI